MPGFGRIIRKLPVNAALAVRYPEAWNDDLAIAKLAPVKSFIENRSVAVVGNAASIFENAVGSEIDDHDVVIRMNHGYVRDPLYQGRRTDILCLSCQLNRRAVKVFDPKYMIFTSRRRDTMKFSTTLSHHKLYFVPVSFYEELADRLGTIPSTGLVVLQYLTRYCAPKQTTLFGFDWMKSKSFYMKERISKWHDWSREEVMVSDWLAAAPAERQLRLPENPQT